MIQENNMRIVLASQSPRRKELLKHTGLDFTVQPSNFEEPWDRAKDPEVFARESAQGKAEDVLSTFEDRKDLIVIGADTVVAMDKVIYGKPDDEQEAYEMLLGLSDRTHRVMTGFSVICPDKGINISGTEITEVTFAKLSSHEINRYIVSGEPMDKAGAYGIQGGASIFVTGIKGCYFNVVGLPVRRIYEALGKCMKL